MFTGIVEELGTVLALRNEGNGRRLRLGLRRVLDDLKPEDSLMVNGVCLTAVSVDALAGQAEVQAVGETLSKTTIGQLGQGHRVHVERALTLSTRLGGHLVQGHVDCAGRVTRLERRALGAELELAFPAPFLRYVARTGSICLDGVSLTVADQARQEGGEGRARVALIPYTLEHTLLGERRPGEALNVEFDCLAKYIEQLLSHGAAVAGRSGGLGLDALEQLGY